MRLPVFIAYEDNGHISYSIIKNDRFIYTMTYTIGMRTKTITYTNGATIEVPRLLLLYFLDIGDKGGCKVNVEDEIPPISPSYSDIDIRH